MLSAILLNRFGLIVAMLGTWILFKWGPPQPSFGDGVGIGLEDETRLADGRTVAEHNREQEAARKFYVGRSRVGLGLVGLGFLLQFIASFL